jgi:hypothetical protein
MPEYNATFGDEREEDSVDDCSVLELSNRNKVLLQQALPEHAAEVSDYQGLSGAHRTVADGLQLDDSAPIINHDNIIIQKGVVFKTMEAMKIWLVEYAMFRHSSFVVKHANENKRYVVFCHRGCPWTVRARKGKDGCTKVLNVGEQKVARDLFWEAICLDPQAEEEEKEEVEKLLEHSITKNQFVGEPHLVLAQVYLNMERYGEAEAEAEAQANQGLKLLL